MKRPGWRWIVEAGALAACLAAGLAAAPAWAAALSPEEARQLRDSLDRIVASSALAGARAGIVVTELESGAVVYAHDADELLNPASNVKLCTTAAALARLGPEYRFETEFRLDAPARGTAARSLYVRGKGDPSLTTERLWAIAGELALLGLGTVRDLVVDDSWFDAEREGPGFDQEQGDRAYLAPASALSLNFNAVAIHVAPGSRPGEKGRVALEPMSDFFELRNETVTVRASARRRVVPSSLPLEGRQRIVVQGRLPLGGRAQVVWRKIDHPTLYLGHTLRRLLELRGVKVAGRVRKGAAPDDAVLLHVAESEPLGEVVRRLNKTSNNFVAEQILKTLGAEVRGPPGTWPKGVEAVEEFLASAGLPRGTYVMKNGSGLNDSNRFSARQLSTLLRDMWRRFPLMPEFVGSLPVAGRDGTIRWRMEGTDAVGRLRAKTGTLEGVTSLSGYAETPGGLRLVFAVLVNDAPSRGAAAVRAVDAIGATLAGAGSHGQAVALAAAPAEADDPAAGDVRARLQTYRRLGAAADRRNLPFLRTALRTERDPALRMAVAEAIWRSDPDGDTSRRTFLDSLSADPDAVLRLRALAGGDGEPVLDALADLAAEGLPEALARLLDLAAAAAREPALLDAWGDALVEVARTAPEETLAALRGAAGAEVATRALARGLLRSGERDHPFLAALARAAAEGGEAADWARALAARLDEETRSAAAALRAPPAPARAPAAGSPPPAEESRPGGG
ncbi:MAG TPA: D-alanyl-D-alanine carboxypeptidase/D-alanyl-D-alanine-endopeptidase [Anaeromyxobacteraceae bacterium]|nr:D-alanyl-D-alanine carboxypeptidase/D-alanyl-D-alanine-endopeptidase [Anaeromyxobacteraceae bacterium]